MAQQLLSRSPALGAPQRRTCLPCAFQKSSLLPIRAAPQKTTPFVPSSSPAQAARPLSRPLQRASKEGSTSLSLSSRAEVLPPVLWSVGSGLIAMALIAVFCTMFPMTPDTYTLHVVVALALSIRARDETSSSASSSSLSRPLRRAWLRRSTSDDQPANTPPNTFWAEALRHLRRHANRSPPTSWAEVLIDLLWNFGAGLLGVAFLAYILPRLPSPTPAGTINLLQFLVVFAVCRCVTPLTGLVTAAVGKAAHKW